MLAALFSFLGGSVFRMIWGEVSSFINKKQDHEQELALAKLQSQLEGDRHTRDLERLKLQSDLGVKEITVMGDMEVQKKEADAFIEAIRAAAVPVGMPQQINRTRLIEAVITAMVSGAMISAMGYYLAFPVLQE